MMKSIYILIPLMLTFLLVDAQNPYPKEDLATLVLKKKLAVQLSNEVSETAKIQNKTLRQIFIENWSLTEIEFLTKEQIAALKKSKNENYAFLTQSDELRKDVRSGYISEDGRLNHVGFKPGETKFNYVAFTFSYYNFTLDIFKGGKIKNVTKIGFANSELTKIDYLYLNQQLLNLISSSSQGVDSKDFYNITQNIEDLASSKLVLLDEMFKEKDKNKIPSYYNYNYKLVGWEEYQDMILNKRSGYCYVKIIWSNHHQMYMWVSVDSETGSIKSITSFGGVNFGIHHEATDIIKVKHLSYITKPKAQKINSRY